MKNPRSSPPPSPGVDNPIRPSAEFSTVEEQLARLREQGMTLAARVTMKEGWVQRIDVDDPRAVNDFRVLHHLERYWFAREYLKDREVGSLAVIDVGLGEGWGLREFLRGLPAGIVTRAAGVENVPAIAEEARERSPNLEVITANVETVRLETPFDVVFCFELIGNDSLGSDQVLLRQLDRLCAPGGWVFLSIAAFKDTDAGLTRTKAYSARIYDTPGFRALVEGELDGYALEYFGQTYPLKRMTPDRVGVWENPDLAHPTDFLICVARKRGGPGEERP